MFKTPIYNTPFTTQAADAKFGNINGDELVISGAEDRSWLSTARALVGPRMGENDELYIRILKCTYNDGMWSNYTASPESFNSILESAYNYNNCRNSLVIVRLAHRDGNRRAMELIAEHGEESMKLRDQNWAKLEVITTFFEKNFPVVCFINPIEKMTVFFVDDVNYKKMHYLQICMLTAMPWYFNPAVGDTVSDDEMALMYSLRESTPTKYMEALKKIADAMDFEAEYILNALNGFESSYERRQIDSIKNDIDSYIGRINDLYDQIQRMDVELRQKNALLFGMEDAMHKKNGIPEMSAFFNAHKGVLVVDGVGSSRVSYHVKTYLNISDEDELTQRVNDLNGVFYRLAPEIYDKNILQKVFRKIFLDGDVKVRICAGYWIDSNGTFNADSYHNFNGDEATYVPNTHIQEYGCLGEYRNICREYASRFDFTSVVGQSIASAGVINWSEGPTSQGFLRSIMGRGVDERPCFEFPDGTLMKFSELYEYVKTQE